ncbi:arginase family protein [Bradyrhizobium liaoningense]|uniref:arginase family protein n=1 Tax=Bradyrhizobium liaoningense TaxID=43992 RepID=UPI001BA43EA4|nr:arginase family protein [Bradyrhizobium liaoningense]MBR0707322.1 arginase family protein [Bradyrhizobium liaoningense]
MPRVNRPYVGIPSFLRARICEDLSMLEAAIAVLGVPFDEGSPFMPGSRLAPRALREHSLRFYGSGQGYYDPETRREYLVEEMSKGLIADVGDVDIHPANAPRTFENITAMVRGILDRGALPVVLGGDHSITYPVFRAFDEKLHVIHFDAHTDYAPFENDLTITNSHAFRHIAGMDNTLSLTQVGIRSLRHSPAQVEEVIAGGNRVIPMGEFRRIGAEGIAALLPANSRVYVSIDVDAMDMSLVPGCVSAEPNGMSYVELRDSLKAIAERHDIAGFDFVEVNPPLDVGTGVTAYLGALTVVEFLGHICAQPRWAARRLRLRGDADLSS